MTHCVFVSNIIANLSNENADRRLMERFCLTETNLNSSSYLPLCEFVESEHLKTENIHFQFPFLMSWTSTFCLLIKVSIARGWGRWSTGWDGFGGGEGEEVCVNTLFKLWTIYLWSTSPPWKSCRISTLFTTLWLAKPHLSVMPTRGVARILEKRGQD